MARIRSIKPEFWSDEKLSECSLSARLLFIGLWSFADDEGRMEFQPARIKMQIFPCGSVTAKQLTEYLGELTERSLIRIYTFDSRKYLDLPNFAKHQKINRPTPSKLPEFSLSAHGELSEPSPLEGKGKEGSVGNIPLTESKASKPRSTAKSAAAKSPIPEDFDLNDERRTYAEKHLPDVNAIALMETFRSTSKAKGWQYVDWDQHWQTLVRQWAPNSGHWSSGQYPRRSGVTANGGKSPYANAI